MHLLKSLEMNMKKRLHRMKMKSPLAGSVSFFRKHNASRPLATPVQSRRDIQPFGSHCLLASAFRTFSFKADDESFSYFSLPMTGRA